MRVDELNYYSKDSSFIDIEQYFDEMELTDKQKEDRKELAYNVKDAVLFLLALMSFITENETITFSFILEQFKNRFRQEVARSVEIDDYLESYISDITTSIVSTCFMHLDAFQESTKLIESDENAVGGNFFNSEERAILIGENESNSVLNYYDYQKAIETGYTRKKWLTMRDRKVRKTHVEVDAKSIPIKDYFLVGNSLMLFPHDPNGEPEEIVNCRCSIKYLK